MSLQPPQQRALWADRLRGTLLTCRSTDSRSKPIRARQRGRSVQFINALMDGDWSDTAIRVWAAQTATKFLAEAFPFSGDGSRVTARAASKI